MKKISLFIGLFLYALTSAGADCNLEKEGRYTGYTIKSWTGGCTNNVISGDGKGVFVNNIIKNANLGDGEEIFVGRFANNPFNNGTIGPAYQVTKSVNKYAHVLYFSSKPALGMATSDNDENGKPIAYTCFQNTNILSKNSMCSQQLTNNSPISFDEVINRLYQYANQKNVQSINKDTFLSMVIEADYKKDQAIKEQLKDDAPVAGVKLSLSGNGQSSDKPKKKSKKKN